MNTALADIEVESSLREKAENILNEIGMTYSQAINLFTNQIILRRAFPVELSVPMQDKNLPEDDPELLKKYGIRYFEDLTDEECDAMLQQAYEDHKAGRYYSLEEAERILEEEWNEIVSRSYSK